MGNIKYPAGNPQLPPQSHQNALKALSRNQLSQGEWVAQFEREFAAYIGTEYAVACANGTAALHLALEALNIGKGDAVIVPALTFVATANAVTYTGATPIVVDVDPQTWTLDPTQVEVAVNTHPNVKAVIAVHLYGVPCDMSALAALCRYYDLYLIEDAAEALGGQVNGAMVGNLADVACFSFYANKTLFTGEGGMITTSNPTIASNAALLRGQGQNGNRYYHTVIGYNYRMTDLQAAIGVGQLATINKTLAYRSVVYRMYIETGRETQVLPSGAKHGYWAFPTLLSSGSAADIEGICLELGLEIRPVFYPIQALPPYRTVDHLPTPVANDLHQRGVVLPIYPSLTTDDVIAIVDILEEALDIKAYYAAHP